MLAGESGVETLTFDWVEQLPVKIAAPIHVEPAEVLTRPETRRLDRSGQFALVAAREAWADAGTPDVEGERLGVVLASGIGGVITLLDAYDVLKERGPRRVLPMTVPMLMPNGPAAAVGLELGARAGVHTPVSACASGAEAISYGMDMIRNGRADVVACGGTEAAIHALPLAGFAAMQALSSRNDEPTRASRPYDKGRDGFVLGEGAGVVVLESAEHAAARGARVYAEVAGAGLTADAHHIAAPDPVGAGAARAMRLALEDAGLSPADISHLNAHATSTPVGDVAEVAAIRAALGDDTDHVAVSATKSMTGHLLGAAGAVEAIAVILTLYNRLAPPTVNLEDLDDEVSLDVVRGAPRAMGEGPLAALNNSFGFGGHNVALALRSVR
jgi:3-oxoacyl-[acyl-carrier-protein] synthase II